MKLMKDGAASQKERHRACCRKYEMKWTQLRKILQQEEVWRELVKSSRKPSSKKPGK